MRFHHIRRYALVVVILLAVAACTGTPKHSAKAPPTPPGMGGFASDEFHGRFKIGTPYNINGVWYYPKHDPEYVEEGIASWYGPNFHGKPTANGAVFDMYQRTAAHPTLPMPSHVRVTNLDNGRSMVLLVNDRGPFKKNRIIDVSKQGAMDLGFINEGTARVRVEYLEDATKQLHARLRDDQREVQVASNTVMVPLAAASHAQARSQQRADAIAHRYASMRGGVQPLVSGAPGEAAVSVTEPIEVAAVSVATPPESGQRDAPQRITPAWQRNAAPPQAKPAPSPPPSAAEEASGLFVQAGAFKQPDHARRLATRLAQVERTVVTPAVVQGRQWYRVRLGPLSGTEHAEEIMLRLASLGLRDTRIVKP